MKHTFRALKYRNYRLFFIGQGISLIGTWMQMVAIGWLVYRLTGSAMMLGTVNFVSQIPALLISPIAGVLADRWNKMHILIVTQTILMIQAFTFAFLVLAWEIENWQVIVLSLIAGIVNAFDAPARQSFLIHLIDDKADFGNAIALNSSMFNGARLIGPFAAGLLISTFGEGECFLINAVSFIAVLIAFKMMRIKSRRADYEKKHVISEMKEGFNYVFSFLPMKAIILTIALVSLTGFSYNVLMPVFAADILHGDAKTLGFLMSAGGIGALAGALLLASNKSVIGIEKKIPIFSAVFGAGLIILSFARSTWLCMLVLFFVGMGMISIMTTANTLLQTIVSDDKRGRVMSFYTTAFFGVSPFGSLLAGWMASKIGTPNAIMVGGIVCLGAAFIFAMKLPQIRQGVCRAYKDIGFFTENPGKACK